MNPVFKKIAIKILGRYGDTIKRMRRDRTNRIGIASYGQEGEDRVLASLLFKLHGGALPSRGFFVDVGAHDPFRFSNTYFFYKLGWTGINIDAAPGSMKSFMAFRSRDMNLEVGVGSTSSVATFYIFNEPALNTFDSDLAKARCIPPWKVVDRKQVEILPLREIFRNYLAADQKIDFMTIDVEGRDLDVLRSNDWHAFRPKVVVIETFGKSIEEAAKDPVTLFLIEHGFVFFSKTVNTSLFVDSVVLGQLKSAS